MIWIEEKKIQLGNHRKLLKCEKLKPAADSL
jgi:hypothetical protein